jgi:hypothetical protein
MNFADIMKDEIGRKRKNLAKEITIDNSKKYFKRGDLARVQKEKYEERMGVKKAPAPDDRIKALEAKTQAMLERLGPDQAKMIPREVVMRKLRDRYGITNK